MCDFVGGATLVVSEQDASQGARADPIASMHESGESAEGSVAPASADISDGLPGPSTSPGTVTCTGASTTPAPAPAVPTVDRNYERIRKIGATEFEGTLDPEVAERWWEKVEDVMNLVGCTPENRLKYIVSLFVGNALIWWRSLKRAYEPREITWAEFQREFDDKYRPKMYRDKKRMEFLNLVQGDEQTVAEYELRFAALAKYAQKQ
ncbi:UNVERIFIED_CONTAM: hypothetical protein Sangu_2948300 [Sesamum angustifolium]|uniref:Retrotransposon gag domain-containing protein n=1 Tax=Sesamum angustifolium TaxID=2727405 RepID=A0AAW2IJW0_9LAMI